MANLLRAVRRTGRTLVSDDRGAPLAAVAAGWFLALGARFVVPSILPTVRADLGFDDATAGLLLTCLWGSYAVMQFPSGLLTDRTGEHRILVVATVLGGVAVAALGVTTDLVTFAAGVILFGLGTGLYATPRVMVISRLYPDRSDTALGVVFASGNVGNTVLPAAAGVVATTVGWRVGFLALAPAFGVVAVALALAVPRDGAAEHTAGSAWDGVGELRRRPVRVVTAALILFAFGYQGLVGFLTTYLVDAKAVSPGTASLAFGGFFAVGLVSQAVSGEVAAAYGRRTLLVGTVALAVVGILTLTALPSTAALALVPILGVQLGVWPVLNAYAYDALSAGARGGGFGFLRSVYLFLGATGPVVVGTLFDAGRAGVGLALCAATFVVVIGVCARLPSVE
ncbi:MAG: CynX/NimT family MFS transporter [Haloferacaceae archaeon]